MQRKVVAGATYSEAWDYAREFFQGLMGLAAECGVTLCMEPLSEDQTDFINTAEEAKRFVDEIDFKGYISVEVHDLSVDAEQAATRSIRYMMKCIEGRNT
jgi:sugar phosphate isomerase/epimerase